MAIETDTITLPSYWASALVNGDYSGLSDDSEVKRVNATIDRLAADGWHVVSTADDDDGNSVEPRFTWHYRLYDPGADCSGGEVLDYVLLREAPHGA